uniref:Uncharacterized protein n=1 Tax=Rhipicephalus appendiculatus TaxID=34631 RepID=A0A131YHG3_RHIAP
MWARHRVDIAVFPLIWLAFLGRPRRPVQRRCSRCGVRTRSMPAETEKRPSRLTKAGCRTRGSTRRSCHNDTGTAVALYRDARVRGAELRDSRRRHPRDRATRSLRRQRRASRTSTASPRRAPRSPFSS